MLRNTFILFISAFIGACVPTPQTPVIPECVVRIVAPLQDPYAEPQAGMSLKQPTHRYVKFHIYNSKEYKNLAAQGVFLLDHSFDAVPDRDWNYTTEHTAQYAVYYGVVPVGLNLSSYHAEPIRNLYMPAGMEAAKIYGPEKQFNGTVTFFDPVDSTMVPLEGVQVIIKSGTKTVAATTDVAGNFAITTTEIARDTVEVLLKFDNNELEIHTLSLNDILGVRGINIYSLGFRKACAFPDMQLVVDKNINSAGLHHSCALLLSFNEFKDFTTDFGLLMPNEKFLMWLGREAPISVSYATPMLQSMSQQNIGNPVQLLISLFGIPADQAAELAVSLKDELPDVYAPFYNRYSKYARASFIETMFHELSHATHYAKVGPDFWLPYVEYIYGNGGYGFDSLPNSGIISMSESWAEDLSNIGLHHIYGKPSYITLNENQAVNWIPYGIYHDLYDSGSNEAFDNVSGITFPMVYGLFTATDTKSHGDLKAKLKLTYPAQSAAIDVLYAHYGR